MDLHHQRVAPIPSAEVPEKLRSAPAVRGFWTDEEMLLDSGISSVAIIKKLAAARWIIADQIPLPEGGRRRVWSFTEVVHAAIVAEVSSLASLPLIATGMLLQAATASWVDVAVDLTNRIDWALHRPTPQGKPDATKVVIVNGREGWREVERNRFELFARDMTLSGAALKVPRVRNRLEADLAEVVGRGPSVHILDLGQLALPVFGRIRETRDLRE